MSEIVSATYIKSYLIDQFEFGLLVTEFNVELIVVDHQHGYIRTLDNVGELTEAEKRLESFIIQGFNVQGVVFEGIAKLELLPC